VLNPVLAPVRYMDRHSEGLQQSRQNHVLRVEGAEYKKLVRNMTLFEMAGALVSCFIAFVPGLLIGISCFGGDM